MYSPLAFSIPKFLASLSPPFCLEKTFKILEYLENKNLTKDWIKEYESTKDKIDYRDSIKEKYKKLKETNY